MPTDIDMQERTAIEQVVAAVEHAQNNELPDEFASLFHQDAIWTTGHGKRLYGRDAILAFTRQALPGAMGDTTVTFQVEHVLFIRSDVAAVKVRQVYHTADGQEVGTPLFVMAKQDGHWLLIACQNTEVVDPVALAATTT